MVALQFSSPAKNAQLTIFCSGQCRGFNVETRSVSPKQQKLFSFRNPTLKTIHRIVFLTLRQHRTLQNGNLDNFSSD